MFNSNLMLWAALAVMAGFLIDESMGQLSSVQVERIEVNPVEPKPGESVKIRCYLKNVDPSKKIKPSILWSIQEEGSTTWRIIGNGATITDTFNNRLSGRKESNEVFEIVFRPIQETDAGTVKCEITNTEGQIFRVHKLNIFSQPYINFITQDIYAQIGKSVTLECQAEGYPKPVVRWSRLGEMSAVLYSNKIEITSVGREDRGTYKCYAENAMPINKNIFSAEAFVTLTVDFPPAITCDTYIMNQVQIFLLETKVFWLIDWGLSGCQYKRGRWSHMHCGGLPAQQCWLVLQST